jgi:hypothetical protein
LFSSAAFVKLKLPVITVSPSMMITLLWAMACWASILVGIQVLFIIFCNSNFLLPLFNLLSKSLIIFSTTTISLSFLFLTLCLSLLCLSFVPTPIFLPKHWKMCSPPFRNDRVLPNMTLELQRSYHVQRKDTLFFLLSE